MTTRWLLALSTIAACSSTARKEPLSSRGTGDDPKLPTHYAALFRPGAAWTYTWRREHRDDDHPRRDATGRVKFEGTAKCSVVEVRAIHGGHASRIDCAPFGDSPHGSTLEEPIAGVWFTDASGLWHGSDWPTPGERPSTTRLVLAAAPTASYTVRRTKSGWCTTEQNEVEGPGWNFTLCFAESGVVSGMNKFSPGSEHDIEALHFELQK